MFWFLFPIKYLQVWNQPLFAFNATIVSQTATSADVSLLISYGKETQPVYRPHPTNVVSETYQYSLELDNQGVDAKYFYMLVFFIHCVYLDLKIESVNIVTPKYW